MNGPRSNADETAPGSLPGRRRVVVAMSGGVDSSVVAALMKAAGHDVIGITLQLYDHGEATGRAGSCCAGQDIHDARRVADAIGIPHYVLDYERRFAETVMESFADSYVSGETPVPCVTCNSDIKFGDLLATAQELGAEVLATGHYIRRVDGPGGPELRRAVDAARDQSYFLFSTTKEQLARLWFPLGDLPKAEVRGLAASLALPVATKPDSQDICFVPTGRYTDIIEKLRPDAMQSGDIVHVDGRRLGRHTGIINFTVGQRRGLGIPAPEPYYVIRLDADRREVVVGPRECLLTVALQLRNVNWLGDGTLIDAARGGLEIFARVRSTQAPAPATLSLAADGGVRVLLADGIEGVAAGQACVFYSDGSESARILGGGVIASAETKPSPPGPTSQAHAARRHGSEIRRPSCRWWHKLVTQKEKVLSMRTQEPALTNGRSPVLHRDGGKIVGIGRIDESDVKVAYRRWAPVYDHTFGFVATQGRRHVVEEINKMSGRVLEVGVGTGLSLPDYKRNLEIVGIDLSPEMLEKARERVAEDQLSNVTGLHEMDAGELEFPDASFDVVVAMFVMTVVPDPERVMRELNRVTRPGGQVLIVNHFSQDEGVRGWIERRMAPFADKIGWRSVFDASRVMGCKDLRLVERQSVRPLGLFTMMRFAKSIESVEHPIAAE